MQQCDVVVVGAGVAGLALAARLANTTLKIVVIEARPFQFVNAPHHVRVSAYNLASQAFLSEVGAWAYLKNEDRTPFRHIDVWDARGNGRIEFDATDIAKSALGHIIANQAIIEALRRVVERAPNIHLMCPAPGRAIQVNAENVQVDTHEGMVQAKLLVGADGANSWVREQLAVPFQQSSYGSSALIATVRTEKPHDFTARQIFLETGPLAFLPLHDPHCCSIVWSTLPNDAARLQALSESEFCDALSGAFQQKLGMVEARLDQPMVFPLVMRHVKQYVGQRFALIGDAAHTIHPLAGQGINLGLQDARELAQTILMTCAAGRDLGYAQNIRPFERARKGDNQLMITAMQAFKTVFGTEMPVIASLRNVGLNQVNSSRFIKRQFMRHAMGV